MLNKRSLTIFASTFALVLVAGAAFAQVESWAPSALEGDTATSEPVKATTTLVVEEDLEETTVTTKVEEEEKDERVHDDDPPDLVVL